MFVHKGKVEAHPRMEQLKVASLASAPALLTNIKLGLKGLSRTNTLAYYGQSQITDVKSLITLGPER